MEHKHEIDGMKDVRPVHGCKKKTRLWVCPSWQVYHMPRGQFWLRIGAKDGKRYASPAPDTLKKLLPLPFPHCHHYHPKHAPLDLVQGCQRGKNRCSSGRTLDTRTGVMNQLCSLGLWSTYSITTVKIILKCVYFVRFTSLALEPIGVDKIP